MEYIKRNKYDAVIIILCAVILLPIFIVGFFARPAADDFSYSFLTHAAAQSGNIFSLLKAAWETNINFYNSWQGLYTSAFLLSLQPGIFGEKFYAFASLIVILFSYLPLLWASHIVNKHFFKRPFIFSVSLSLIIFTMLVIWLPDINDGIYWFNGAMNYTPWAFVNICSLCLLLDIYTEKSKNKKIFYIAVCTILAFLTSGGNHVTAFANILLLFSALLIALAKKRFYPAFPFIAACIGFIIMFKAPGTAVRQAYFESPGVIKTITATILHVHQLASEWFSIKWLIGLVILTPIAIEFGNKNKEKLSKLSPIHIILAVLMSAAVIYGMFCVPYYAMKGFGMGRVTNVIWITFNFLSWFIYFLTVGMLVAKDYINSSKIISGKHSKALRFGVITVGICCMVIIFEHSLASWSVKAASELIHGIPQGYAQEMDERTAMYKDPSLYEIYVEPIKHKSELLYSTDVGTNANEWPNDSISAYYGKKIVLKQ